MGIHRYPIASLVLDGLRSASGLTLTLGPLLFLDLVWPLAVAFGGFGVLFLVFTFRLLEQALSSIERSAVGLVRHGPRPLTLLWSELGSVRLSRYAVPRRAAEGWYQLTIRSDSGTLTIDSTINGFEDLVRKTIEAAEEQALNFDPVTTENLRSLGFPMVSEPISG